MTIDPFADDVQPVAEAVTETDNSNDVWNETVEVQNVTSPEGVTRISLTFKAGSSFDSPWVVVEGGTVPGVLGELKSQGSDVAELFGLVANGAKAFQKNYGGGAAPAPQAQASRPPQQSAPAGVKEPEPCVHGARVYKSGVSKAGKAYKMWACPSGDRNNQCAPEWVR